MAQTASSCGMRTWRSDPQGAGHTPMLPAGHAVACRTSAHGLEGPSPTLRLGLNRQWIHVDRPAHHTSVFGFGSQLLQHGLAGRQHTLQGGA